MTELFTELLKFFSEFTLKKLVAFIVVLLGVFIVASIYELYTSDFRFNRLQKAADLLDRVEEIDSRGTNNAPELERARKELVSQVNEAISLKPITLDFVPSTLKFSMDGAYKFAAGASLWLFFSLFQIRHIGHKDKQNAFFGILMMAFMSGFCGMFVPSIWWPWFHIFIFPFVFFFCIIVALAPFAYIVGKRAAKQKAQAKAGQNYEESNPATR